MTLIMWGVLEALVRSVDRYAPPLGQADPLALDYRLMEVQAREPCTNFLETRASSRVRIIICVALQGCFTPLSIGHSIFEAALVLRINSVCINPRIVINSKK